MVHLQTLPKQTKRTDMGFCEEFEGGSDEDIVSLGHEKHDSIGVE